MLVIVEVAEVVVLLLLYFFCHVARLSLGLGHSLVAFRHFLSICGLVDELITLEQFFYFLVHLLRFCLSPDWNVAFASVRMDHPGVPHIWEACSLSSS